MTVVTPVTGNASVKTDGRTQVVWPWVLPFTRGCQTSPPETISPGKADTVSASTLTITGIKHIPGDDPDRIHYYVQHPHDPGMQHLCVCRPNPLYDLLDAVWREAHEFAPLDGSMQGEDGPSPVQLSAPDSPRRAGEGV